MLENGAKAWGFSSLQYTQAAVKHVEKYLSTQEKWTMPKKTNTPISASYCPKLDISPELNSKDAAYFMSLIGILRWIVELGRVDVCLEVSMMSSYLASPCEGHLKEVLRIFAYLKKFHNAEMVFDPSNPIIDHSAYERKDWLSTEFGHLDQKEELPPNMPEPRGMGLLIWD